MNEALIPWMKWHRWAGLGFAIFIVLVCITGILLNHGAALGLARHYVQSPWLLDLYDLKTGGAPVSFAAGAHHVSLAGGRLYFDAQELPERGEALLGAVGLQDQVAVALPGRLLFLTPDGAVIERLRAVEGVPPDLRRIGAATSGQLVVETNSGRFLPDLDALRWDSDAPADVNWAAPVPLPVSLTDAVLAHARGNTLTLERVLLDVHSGRIATRLGAWFLDLVALALVSLVISGLWIWWKR